MKNKLILIMIGLLLVSIPELTSQDLRFGLLGGFDLVTIHRIPKDPHQTERPYDPITSYNINCFFSLKSKGIWGITVEPGVIQKGGLTYKSRAELRYFQMPISADVYILRRLCFSIGPEFSYLVSAKSINPSSIDDISGIFNKNFEFSGAIGLKIFLAKKIAIGFRYNHGLTFIHKSPQYGDNWEIVRWLYDYNEYFQFTIGYNIFSKNLR